MRDRADVLRRQREATARYRATERGKATEARYAQSYKDKRPIVSARYRTTHRCDPEYKATIAASNRRDYEKHRKRRIADAMAYRYANPEKRKQAYAADPTAAINGAHRYRSLKKSGHVSRAEWLAILADYSNRCAYCNVGDVKLEQDHFVPLSKDGEHCADNIVPACRSCNSSKNNKSYIVWLAMKAA